MSFERFAPAKVNLFLHVGPLQADGYHPICSLMTFANVGDRLRMEPAREMSFAAAGPFASELGADEAGNLVVRAREAVMAAFERPWAPFRLALEKNLPVASGLGGGSSDAAAALHLMSIALAQSADALVRTRAQRDAWRALAPEVRDQLVDIAARLGSDVPACLGAAPVIAEGRGDECDLPPVFPDLDAVLVNPLVASPTGAVYSAYDDAGAPGSADRPPWPDAMESPKAVTDWLAGTRNDLEAPAIALAPAIGEVLAALRAGPETLYARMSGSGASCFALCASERDARDLALAISDAHRSWWVQPCRLAGYRP